MSREGTPFRFEGPLPPALLIDRDVELDTLARRAADRVAVRLAAPRRFGKTSLLLAHAQRLRETGWRTAHVDFSRVTDLTDVARRLAGAYAGLDPAWMRTHLAGLLGRLGITLGAGGPAVSVGARPTSPDPEVAEAALYRLLDLPLTLWKADRTPTLVVFDEFQDLLVARGDLDGVLRSRIQYHDVAAAYVYAGSEPSMMRELFDNRERPLFGQADPLELAPLPLEDVLAALSVRFAAEELDPGEALGELVLFAAGHPQRTMLLAYLLAERVELGHEGTSRTAHEVVDDALARTEPAHQALWTGLGRSERVALAAAADGIPPASRSLALEHRLGRQTLSMAAGRLVDHGHVARERVGTRVLDPLLAEWLRRR